MIKLLKYYCIVITFLVVTKSSGAQIGLGIYNDSLTLCFDSIRVVATDSVNDFSISEIRSADFDGDGKKDIIYSINTSNGNYIKIQGNNSPSEKCVPTLFNISNYSVILPQAPHANTTTHYDIAVGDFNNDSRIDYAYINSTDSTVHIFKNTSSFTFTQIATYTVSGGNNQTGTNNKYLSLEAADFNDDLKMDLAVFFNNALAIDVEFAILKGNGNLTFITLPTTQQNFKPFSKAQVNSDDNLHYYTVADLNKDNKADIVLTLKYYGGGNNDTICILESTATGTTPTQPFNFVEHRHGVSAHSSGVKSFFSAVGDVNDDKKMDIIISHYDNGNLGNPYEYYLLKSNGTFTYEPHVIGTDYSNTLMYPTYLKDMDSDSLLDIVTLGEFSTTTNHSQIFIQKGINTIPYFKVTAETIPLPTSYSPDFMLVDTFETVNTPGLLLSLSPPSPPIDIRYISNHSAYLEILGKNYVCDNDNVILTAKSTITAPVHWNGSVQSNTFSAISGKNYFNQINTFNNQSVCHYSDSINVVQKNKPIITLSVTPSSVCSGDLFSLNVMSTSAKTYTLLPNDISFTTTAFEVTAPSVQVNTLETYTVIGVKDSTNQCIGIATTDITVLPLPRVTVNVYPNPVCAGKTSTISVIGGIPTSWLSNDSIISPTENTTYTIEVKGAIGCKYLDTVKVTIDKDCLVKPYTGITPNGDGVNDGWYITNIEAYDNNKVSIYSRWGLTIFDTKNYNNTNNFWDGKANGITVTAGTYYYVIQINEGKNSIKGWLEVTTK